MIPIIKDRTSPNFSVRKTPIDSIIIHHTGGTSPGCLAWLCDSQAKVSAHYVVVKNGQIYQLVEDHSRAWHAGRGAFDIDGDGIIVPAERFWNDRSIGIELEAVEPYDYPEFQLDSLDKLMYHLMLKHHISADHILGHKEIAPGRKIDPANFNMNEFREHIKGIMSA